MELMRTQTWLWPMFRLSPSNYISIYQRDLLVLVKCSLHDIIIFLLKS